MTGGRESNDAHSLTMRILAVGDIHGCSRAFDALLALVDPRPADRIITLGDYVDRGPDSRGVLDRLLRLRKTHDLVSLRGNHEQMMCDARLGGFGEFSWLAFGGRETLASYGTPDEPGTLADVPAEHWDFIEHVCVDWYEMNGYFFVHGTADPELPLAEQSLDTVYYGTFDAARPHVSGKLMVCGHTAQKGGAPAVQPCGVCIDTWVYGDGWLSCLDVPSGRVWQANQKGQKRTAWLHDFVGTVQAVDDAPAAEGTDHA